ncbi:MAG: hypothetical protein Q7R52_04965 [archaeon]|nr:hypothetical protein [archaeon]
MIENLEIPISFALMIINVIALAVGYYIHKFKITTICLILFNVLTIIVISKSS